MDEQKTGIEEATAATFMRWMAKEIKLNAPTKGDAWQGYTDTAFLIKELETHTVKLKFALQQGNDAAVIEHLADDFCYLMFIARAKGFVP